MPVKNDTPKEEFDFSNKELDESSPLNLKNDTKMMTESYRLAMSNFSVDDAKKYLIKYHYGGQSSKKSKTLAKLNDITSALKKFQCLWDLTQTGELDDKTKELMLSPRCGVPDDNIKCKKIGGKYRKKRYIFSGNKWWKKNLKYNINNFSNDLGSISLLEKEIHRAFEVWGSVSPLTFQSVGTNVIHDIDIVFARGPHGDADNFDGKGGTLAHAFTPPPYDLQGRTVYGDAHFDDDETFSMNTYKDINLFQVAVHEFGHVLGLRHSENWKAVMAPFYRSYTPYFKLHEDDINGIQELYGQKLTYERNPDPPRIPEIQPTQPPRYEPPQRPSQPNSYCQDSRIDAIVTSLDRTVYAFKDNLYFSISNDIGAVIAPRKIRQDWPNLPDNIDAAIYDKRTGYNYYFKDSNVYYFVNKQYMGMRDIGAHIRNAPSHIDSIFYFPSGNTGQKDILYFTKGIEYYRIREDSNNVLFVDDGYPKYLARWWYNSHTTIQKIDAAFIHPQFADKKKQKLYFFSGNDYYVYDARNYKLDYSYPRNIGTFWLGCSNDLMSSISSHDLIQKELMSLEYSNNIASSNLRLFMNHLMTNVIILLCMIFII